MIVDIIHFPEGDGVVVGLYAGPAPGDGVVVVPLVENLVSLPCTHTVSVGSQKVKILLKFGTIIFYFINSSIFKKTFSLSV